MRPFEWLLFMLFGPALLIPFVPQTWRRPWLAAAVSLPLLAVAIHLVVEGWRVQMLPMYILAALVFVFWLPEMIRPGDTWRKRRAIWSAIATATGLALCGALAGWALPVVTLPEPTGPYPVGVVDRELVDAARGRRLMASIWYPASRSGARALLTRYPDEVAEATGDLSGVPGVVFQHLRYSTVAASEGVPVAADGAPFPVLVFSHGMVGLRLQNSPTMQDLASWGYVVVAVDHTDAAAVTVFPDGEVRRYDMARFGIPADTEPNRELVNERVFPVWVADQRFVYDMLETWEAHDTLLAGRLDLAHIGSFGHSFGGATALEVCQVDPRCGAAADLDGGLYGVVETQPAVKPLLLMISAASRQNEEAVKRWTNLIEHAKADRYWYGLTGSTHYSFTMLELISPLLVPRGFDPRAGLGTIDQTVRAFFDRYLRGRETVTLEPSSGRADIHWVGGQP